MAIRYFEQETERFEAIGSDGKQYVLVESTNFAEVAPVRPDAAPTLSPGKKVFRTWPGDQHVVLVSGRLVIVGTAIVLSRR